MNRSGEALAQLHVVRDASDLIVVHDEIDLPCGGVRVKIGGGTAGHRGVASIATQYGSEFTRIRVGVGRPTPGADVAEYVLGRFGFEEETVIADAIRAAADAVECVLQQGHQTAMQRFNTRQPEPQAPAQASAKE
jgi:PTH1 family peptidyl-tRNA hydrolase